MATRGLNNRTRSRITGLGGGGSGTFVPPAPLSQSIVARRSANNASSYPGTGTNITSLIAAPADGTTQAANLITIPASPNNPTFVGTAGTPAALFNVDAGNQYFRSFASTLTSASMVNNWHRTDQTSGFWYAWMGTIPEDSSAIHTIAGDANSGTSTGINISVTTGGVLQLNQRVGTTTVSCNGPGVPRGIPVFIIISWNFSQTANPPRFWVNNDLKWNQASFAPNASTTGSTRDFFVMAGSLATTPVAIGSTYYGDAYGNMFIDDYQAQQLITLWNTERGIDFLQGGRFGAPQKEILLDGDSITYFDQYGRINVASSPDTGIEQNVDGYFIWYNTLTNQRFHIGPKANIAVPGTTTTDALNRIAGGYFYGQAFDVVNFASGINDLRKATGYPGTSIASTVNANIDAYLTAVCGNMGKNVILHLIAPCSNWIFSGTTAQINAQIAAAQADRATINAHILSLDGSYGGRVIAKDDVTVLDDGTGAPIANMTVDGLHRSGYGAYIQGQQMAANLATQLGALQPILFTTNNLLTNPTMAGTGGTVTAPATGSVATSWNGAVVGGSSPAATFSKAAANTQQIVFSSASGGAAASQAQLNQTVSTGFAAGDVLAGVAEINVLAPTPVNIIENAFQIALSGTGLAAAQITNVRGMSAWSLNGGATGTQKYVPEEYVSPGKYQFVTADMYISQGTGLSITASFDTTGDLGLAASETIQITGAMVYRKLAPYTRAAPVGGTAITWADNTAMTWGDTTPVTWSA